MGCCCLHWSRSPGAHWEELDEEREIILFLEMGIGKLMKSNEVGRVPAQRPTAHLKVRVANRSEGTGLGKS